MVAMTKHRVSSAWALADELAVQTLYLVDGFTPKQISQSLTRDYQAVRRLIWSRGWTAQRRNKSELARASTNAHSHAHIERVVKAQAVLAESASVAGLKRAMESAQSGSETSARDFRAWAGGARDLVNVARLSRGLDAAQQQQNNTSLTLAMFLVKGERELKNVAESTPVDVSATPLQVGPATV
jgi:hypothetical protein